ncbi:MAG: SDR family NAD(P)-dependent oxidoreductase [Halobacteriales archaeon]|nr:SDR family NAD(P)-dependent oxidoreductase [Halobacteriales archaeon]
MRNLIVGCGFVGTRLARLLVENGEDVTAITRSGVSIEGVESVERDVTDTSLELPDADRVFYLVSAGGRDADAYRSAYVEGLRNTLEATPSDASHVYSSSTGVYETEDGSWVDEETRIEPTKERTRLLLEAEELAREAGGTVVRFGGLYGEGRVGTDRYLDGATVKAGYLNLIRGEDAATSLLAADEGEDDLYVAVDNEPVHRHELARWMAEETGRNVGELVGETRTPNKRCSNERLRSTGWTPEYPTYREGYAPLL